MFSSLDIDECRNKTHTCDVNAVCSITLKGLTTAPANLDTLEIERIALVFL